MRLQKLHLQNFMGVHDNTLEPDGQDAVIRGTNGTFKTTHFSAFTWLLFGKDSRGQAQFDIKTLDEYGQPIHNLEHTVEGTFQLGDDTLALRKTLVEVWTRKRGSTAPEFTGHRVDHYLDGVPVQKKHYDERIAEIAPEGVFRLLTDPDAFHALHWKEKRNLLLDVCGDVTDDEVIDANPDLQELPGIVGKRTFDEHRKVVEARRKEINRDLQAIPVRIDETTQGKPEAPAGTRADLEAELEQLRADRASLEAEKAEADAGGGVAERTTKLRELQEERRQIERDITADADDKAHQAKRDARAASEAEEAKDAEIRKLEARKQEVAEQIRRHAKRRDELRAEWQKVNQRTFHAEHDETCPACGQALPAEQIEAAHAKAREEFNAKRAADLERIQNEGATVKAKLEELEREDASLTEALEVAREERATLASEAHTLRASADELARAVPDPTANADHQKLTERTTALQNEIDAIRADSRAGVERINERIASIDQQIRDTQASRATLDQLDRADARIQELTDQEARLASEYETLEQQLHLLDTFTRAKARMLTDRINAHFHMTRFRLHEEQINGGLADTCTATVDGVPYGTGLNRAARINSGLDVIQALQRHYQFYPPVWVDECESVVETIPLDCQVIKLIVDEDYPVLTVQLEGTPKEVAA